MKRRSFLKLLAASSAAIGVPSVAAASAHKYKWKTVGDASPRHSSCAKYRGIHQSEIDMHTPVTESFYEALKRNPKQ